MSDKIELPITLDLDEHLVDRYVDGGDGEYYPAPTTLEDVVLNLAADKVAKRIIQGDDYRGWRDGVRDRVKAIRDEVIREKVAPDVDDALDQPMRTTNSYGEPTGPETTLREQITSIVAKEVDLSRRSGSFRNERSALANYVIETVDAALKSEFKAAVDKAKAEAVASIRKAASDVIADTIKRASGVL